MLLCIFIECILLYVLYSNAQRYGSWLLGGQQGLGELSVCECECECLVSCVLLCFCNLFLYIMVCCDEDPLENEMAHLKALSP